MKYLSKASKLVFLALCFYSFTSYAEVNDMKIVKDISQKISTDKSLSDLNITVSSNHGNVELNGNANTDEQADKIIEIAQSTIGVKNVNASNLTVNKTKRVLSDAVITAKVKGVFLREELFGQKSVSPVSISVETIQGVVYLSGTADNQTQIENAKKLAKSIDGVKDVKSTITIKS